MSGLEFDPVPPAETEPLPPELVAPELVPPKRPGGVTAPLRPSPPAPPQPDTGGLPGLDKLALILLIIAFVLAAKAFTDFLNWLFRSFLGPLWPRTGSKTVSSQAVTKAAGSYLGTFAQGFDSELGVSFSSQAETVRRAGDMYVAIATRIVKLAAAVAALEQRTAGDAASRNALRHTVQQTQAEQRQTAEQLAAASAATTASLHALRVRVDELQHSVTRLIEPELEALKGAIPELERGASTTWDTLMNHEELLGLGAMIGTVAAATGRLGMDWTRCDSTRELGERICRDGGGTLRNLLDGLLPLIDIAALCGLIRLMAAAGTNREIVDGLGLFSLGIEDLMKCAGASRPRLLTVPALSVGPLTPLAALAPAGAETIGV